MRILFLSDNYPPETNAAASRVHERARYWVEWGHRVTVLTSAPNFPQGKVYPGYRNAWRARETMDGVDVLRVKTFIAPNRGVAPRIADFLSYMASATLHGAFEQKPDLVVATSPQFFCAVAGAHLARIKRVPFVFELADLWPASIRAVGAMRSGRVLSQVERLELSLYRRSAAIIALTRAYREDLALRGIDPAKIAVVRNGVELTARPNPQPSGPQLEAGFWAGYLGTHGMAHGLENVLETAALLEAQPIRFLMMGDGARKGYLVQRAREMKLDNVRFEDPRPKGEVPGVYASVNVALVHLKDDPVFSTVIPSKIFEAMAAGKPVVYVGPAGEASELIQETGIGLCVPPEQPHALASALLKLHANPDLCASFADRARRAAPLFTRERQAREMLNVLERVLAGRPVNDSDHSGRVGVPEARGSHSSRL